MQRILRQRHTAVSAPPIDSVPGGWAIVLLELTLVKVSETAQSLVGSQNEVNWACPPPFSRATILSTNDQPVSELRPNRQLESSKLE